MSTPASERFLIIAPQGLGDSLEATPFIQALHEQRPNARIDVAVTRSGPRELFSGLTGLVTEVIYLPFWETGALAFVRELLVKCRRRPYDASFLMYPAARREYQVVSRAFPARRRFTHRYFDPSLGNLLWLSSDLVEVQKKHNVLRNLDLLEAAGISAAPGEYVVPKRWVAPVTERDRKRVAIHVGTIAHDGLDARRWPVPNFIEVARRLAGRGYDVTVIMGPDERKETLAVKEAVPEVHVFEGTLEEVARFLSTCAVVLTNDSGIGHLAAAVDAPSVALFGPTPLDFAPYGRYAIALRPSDCPPCFDPRYLNTGCALNIDYKCLKRDLTVDIVDSALTRVLAGASILDLASVVR
ncbi:MAG: glycosyltransferase family 9 protein [Vulcanimicrobiaceae bacterium]